MHRFIWLLVPLIGLQGCKTQRTAHNQARQLKNIATPAQGTKPNHSIKDPYKPLRHCFDTLYFAQGSRVQAAWGLSGISIPQKIALPTHRNEQIGFYLIAKASIRWYVLDPSMGYQKTKAAQGILPAYVGPRTFAIEIDAQTRFTIAFYEGKYADNLPTAINAPRIASDNWYVNFPEERQRDRLALRFFDAHKFAPSAFRRVEIDEIIRRLQVALTTRIEGFVASSTQNSFARDEPKTLKNHRYWQHYFAQALKSEFQACHPVQGLATIASAGVRKIDALLAEALSDR